MGVRVAYGQRDRISKAIEDKIIPNDSIIITKGDNGELMFYDNDGNLVELSPRVRFESFPEASAWVLKYGCTGHILSIHNGSDWAPYVVQEGGTLSPVISTPGEITGVKRIDGGKSGGLE